MPNGDWEKQIAQNAENIINIKNDMSKVEGHLAELKMALIGSDKVGLKGLAKRVEDAECYIEKDKKQKWMLAGIITAVASAAGAIWSKVVG